MRFAILLIAVLLIFSFAVVPCMAGGHWVLAFWRCLGKGEDADQLIMRVWTFDENGNVMGNIPITMPAGVTLGTTESSGRTDIVMSVANEYRCTVTRSGETSDISPYMSNGRYPNWGHYSYELGFMYKSDLNNPGTFDTSIVGGSVPRKGSTQTNCPCTASMAYYSLDPNNWYFDESGYNLPSGGWGEHGQYFVATGNRVTCAEFHPTVGGVNNTMQFTVEIRQGGPTGAVIASKTSTTHMNQDWWVVPFGTTICPVTPGQTYFARVYTLAGFNAYYSKGNYYTTGSAAWRANSTSTWGTAPGTNLKGFIVCSNVASTVQIQNPAITPSTGSAVVTWTTDVPSASRVDYGDTSSYGKVVSNSTLTQNHSVIIPQLHGDSQYHAKITSSASGLTDGVTLDMVFTTQSANPNLLVNGGFESGQLTPWVKFGAFGNPTRSDGLGPWCTGKCPIEGSWDFFCATSYGKRNGGAYQQVNNLVPGATYTARMSYFTWQQGGNDSDVADVLIIDPTGGTSSTGASVVKTAELSSQDTWAVVPLSAVAQSSTMTVFLSAIQRSAIQWNQNGFDDVRLTGPVSGTIPNLKGKSDGAYVGSSGKIVTATASQVGAYYIEEPDRGNAIRVEAASGSPTPTVGQQVSVSGWLTTNANGEKAIIDAAFSITGSGSINPVSMLNRDIGGHAGVKDGLGANNVGLLITTWGKVTKIGTGYLYMNDGSALNDGTGNGTGLRVICNTTGHAVGDFMFVTGISSCFKNPAGDTVRQVLMR